MNRRIFLEQTTQAIALLLTTTVLPAQSTSAQTLNASSKTTNPVNSAKPTSPSTAKVSQLTNDEDEPKPHKKHKPQNEKEHTKGKVKHNKDKTAKHTRKSSPVET